MTLHHLNLCTPQTFPGPIYYERWFLRTYFKERTNGFIAVVVYSGGCMISFLLNIKSNELIIPPSGIRYTDGFSPLE